MIRNSVTRLVSFPHAIEAVPFHGWASVVLRAVYRYFACAHLGCTQITLARKTTSPAGKEVEAVTELVLLEKPKCSKLIATLYSVRAVRIRAMQWNHSPPPFSRTHLRSRDRFMWKERSPIWRLQRKN